LKSQTSNRGDRRYLPYAFTEQGVAMLAGLLNRKKESQKDLKMIDRMKLNWEKISNLPMVNDMLDEEYGKEGTPTREAFKREAYAYYTGQIIEQARKEAKMTQEELAEKVGSNKSYISRVETGKTEPKVSALTKKNRI
jgi:DNA-binding transcriptional regulator YiaG